MAAVARILPRHPEEDTGQACRAAVLAQRRADVPRSGIAAAARPARVHLFNGSPAARPCVVPSLAAPAAHHFQLRHKNL